MPSGPAGAAEAATGLDGVIAVVECTVERALPGGDHEIIVGASGTSRPPATARPRWSSGAAATRPSTAASRPSGPRLWTAQRRLLAVIR